MKTWFILTGKKQESSEKVYLGRNNARILYPFAKHSYLLFFFYFPTHMRNLLAVLAALLMLFAGCPGQKPALAQYDVVSLAVDSEEHFISGEYKIYAEVESSAASPNSSLILVISDNDNRFAEISLGGENASGNTSFAVPWAATSAGTHTINATIEDENGTLRSPSKLLNVEVSAIGNPKEKLVSGNVPVDSQIWCAQKFQVESRVILSEAQLKLISLIPTREGLMLTVEIHNDSNGLPSASAVETAKIPAGEVVAESEWHTFTLEGKPYAPGTYWVVLKRGDDTGNLAWDFTQNGDGALCTNQNGAWATRPGMFFFSIK